jgi:hypothetical protein
MPSTIRHVRYRDFFALSSDGAATSERFRESIDALCARMGDVADHPILVDLRGATLPPLRRIELIECVEYCRRKGIGVKDRLAVVVDPADRERIERAPEIESIAASMGMAVQAFNDIGAALDWISRPEGSF